MKLEAVKEDGRSTMDAAKQLFYSKYLIASSTS